MLESLTISEEEAEIMTLKGKNDQIKTEIEEQEVRISEL
jgi:hypothetical protein